MITRPEQRAKVNGWRWKGEGWKCKEKGGDTASNHLVTP